MEKNMIGNLYNDKFFAQLISMQSMPCKNLLSLLESRKLILGDILASLDSFLLILRILEFTIELFSRSYLKGMLSTTIFVCIKGERYS